MARGPGPGEPATRVTEAAELSGKLVWTYRTVAFIENVEVLLHGFN